MSRVTQERPVYVSTGAGAPGEEPNCYVIRLPWVRTSGDPRSPFSYANGTHAAVHSLLCALRGDDIENVRFWLDEASAQIHIAKENAAQPHARAVPRPKKNLRPSAKSAVKNSGGDK